VGTDATVYARVAELQVMLEGVALPASRRELIDYAQRQGAEVIGLLSRLPDREYRTLDEVGEELAPVQPRFEREQPLPHEESDKPPGGDAYLDPSPEPGSIRSG
jgi:hypothetical protein